jgi:hypothetical protein
MASRQVLPFLGLGARATDPNDELSINLELAPSKSLFSLDRFGEDSFRKETPLFNWRTRPIYDINDRLLFYDQTLPLGSENELRVRTAASDLLLTPVWSVRAGRTINMDGLISKALSVIRETPDLEPVVFEKEVDVRLVCYGYPRMGLACFSRTRPTLRFIIDLWDLNFIPVEDTERLDTPAESVTATWSPYDFVSTATVGHFRSRFQRNKEKFKDSPDPPERVEDLRTALAVAGRRIRDTRTTKPELRLSGQQTRFFCAAATAQMILEHHQVRRTQDEIARVMNTVTNKGAEPQHQAAAIRQLTDQRFGGELDSTATFEDAMREIQSNRPFRTGGFSHARACGGYLIEEGGKQWVYIYDPLPTNQGDIYYEAWEAILHCNYIYVTPVKHL